jgi:cobalt-zinc-cadmium efflux system membrane fusion protein
MKRLTVLSLIAFLAACSPAKPPVEPEKEKTEAEMQKVTMTLEAQEHAGVRVAAALPEQLTEYLHVTGTVQPIDARVSEIRPLAKGRIEQVFVHVGDRVRQGQALARFDNIEGGELMSQYQAGRAELERLKSQLAAATRQLERTRSLAMIGAISQRELEASQAEQQAISKNIEAQESVLGGMGMRLKRYGINNPEAGNPETSIAAPFAGVVTRVEAAPGGVVDADRALFSVADLSVVWVQAEVYEKDLGRIRSGQTANITVDTYPDKPFPAKVTYISDVLDPQTRTAKVRCEVGNPDTRLKLDMFANVALPTTFKKEAIAIPEGAVQQINGKAVVFIRLADTEFQPRPVEVGKTVDGLTEITKGLTKGDPIVVSGAFHLKSIASGKELGEGEEH